MLCRRLLPLALFLNRSASTSAQVQSPNHAIIQVLKEHLKQEQKIIGANRNRHKIRAFSTAINIIAGLGEPLRTVSQAKALKGVGPGILGRIRSFLENDLLEPPKKGRPPKPNDLRDQLLDEFRRVPSIGLARAKMLVDAGCTSIPEMLRRQFYDTLTPSMQVELTYYEDLKTLATRKEAETVLQFVRDNISNKFDVDLVGCYRREAVNFSEISLVIHHDTHILIPPPTAPPPGSENAKSSSRGRKEVAFRSNYTNKQAATSSLMVKEVVTPLEERGLQAALINVGTVKWRSVVLVPERKEGEGGSSTWGNRSERLLRIQRHEGTFRRMDINLVPKKSRGAALLALTGDAEFTRDIRNRATELSMHLNEFGLWQWEENQSVTEAEENGKPGFWKLLKSDTEEDIFEALDMDFVPPEKRNFSFLVQPTSPSHSRPKSGRKLGRPPKNKNKV